MKEATNVRFRLSEDAATVKLHISKEPQHTWIEVDGKMLPCTLVNLELEAMTVGKLKVEIPLTRVEIVLEPE